MDKDNILYNLNLVMTTTTITKENVRWDILQEVINKVVRKNTNLKNATRGQWYVIGLMYLGKLDELNEHRY